MDVQQITGLSICFIGAVFFIFRQQGARGAAGYAKNNFKFQLKEGTIRLVEYAYAIFGGIAIILGGYIFFA